LSRCTCLLSQHGHRFRCSPENPWDTRFCVTRRQTPLALLLTHQRINTILKWGFTDLALLFKATSVEGRWLCPSSAYGPGITAAWYSPVPGISKPCTAFGLRVLSKHTRVSATIRSDRISRGTRYHTSRLTLQQQVRPRVHDHTMHDGCVHVSSRVRHGRLHGAWLVARQFRFGCEECHLVQKVGHGLALSLSLPVTAQRRARIEPRSLACHSLSRARHAIFEAKQVQRTRDVAISHLKQRAWQLLVSRESLCGSPEHVRWRCVSENSRFSEGQL